MNPKWSWRLAFGSVEMSSQSPRRQLRNLNTHRILVFDQTLIETTQTDEEQNCRHILEAMDPFSPLALLTANINHEHLM